MRESPPPPPPPPAPTPLAPAPASPSTRASNSQSTSTSTVERQYRDQHQQQHQNQNQHPATAEAQALGRRGATSSFEQALNARGNACQQAFVPAPRRAINATWTASTSRPNISRSSATQTLSTCAPSQFQHGSATCERPPKSNCQPAVVLSTWRRTPSAAQTSSTPPTTTSPFLLPPPQPPPLGRCSAVSRPRRRSFHAHGRPSVPRSLAVAVTVRPAEPPATASGRSIAGVEAAPRRTQRSERSGGGSGCENSRAEAALVEAPAPAVD